MKSYFTLSNNDFPVYGSLCRNVGCDKNFWPPNKELIFIPQLDQQEENLLPMKFSGWLYFRGSGLFG